MGKMTADELRRAGESYRSENNGAQKSPVTVSANTEGGRKKMTASELRQAGEAFRKANGLSDPIYRESPATVADKHSTPSAQPTQAAPVSAPNTSVQKPSDTMKKNLDTIKEQKNDALTKASAYMRAGNMVQQAKDAQKEANRLSAAYANANSAYKTQRNMEDLADYNPTENKFKAGDAALSGIQNSVQSSLQYLAAASAMAGDAYTSREKAMEAKKLMDSGMNGVEAQKQVGLTIDKDIPITDYKTKAELRHEMNVANVGTGEAVALNLINTVANMAPSIVANYFLPGIGLPMMSASAAGNKYSDALEKYGDPTKAFVLGTGAGLASMATEQFGGVYGKMGETALGKAAAKKLMTEAPGLYAVAESVGGKWLRDAISEGIEEGAEDIINYAIEKSLTGDSDEMDNIGYDMLLGALAGGVLGGANAVSRATNYNRLGKAVKASDETVRQEIASGLEKGEGTAPNILAKAAQENPSAQIIGRLYEANKTFSAEDGLSKLASGDITRISVKQMKDMVNDAKTLYEAAKKLGVPASQQAVHDAIVEQQKQEAVRTAENAVSSVFNASIDNPVNAGEEAYNAALSGTAANQGTAFRINSNPDAKQSFANLTGANFNGIPAHDIAEIEVRTRELANSGKQAIPQAEYDARVSAAAEQAQADYDADYAAQAQQMQDESVSRYLSAMQNTIIDVDGKRHLKEITNTDRIGSTEVSYKAAEIPNSKKESVSIVNKAAKYLGKTVVWFEGALQINGQYRLANGFRAPNGTIYLNINAENPLVSVFGHEMFHDLVSNEKYKPMIDTLLSNEEYAEMVNGTIEAKINLYERNGIELRPEEASEEAAADISGEILNAPEMLEYIGARNAEAANGINGFLTRTINKLKGKPSAQEAYDMLSEAQKALIDGMEGRDKTEYSDPSIGEYSLIDTDKGTAVFVDNDILSKIDTSSWNDVKKAIAKDEAVLALKSFTNGIVVNGITYKVNRVSRREYTRSNYTEKLYKTNANLFADKMRAAKYADEIIASTTAWTRDGRLKHQRSDNFVDFARGNVLMQAGKNKYKAEVVVGITDAGDYVFYDVVDIVPAAFTENKTTPTAVAGTNAQNDIQGVANNSLPQTEPAVNNYSMQEAENDAQGDFSLMEDDQYKADIEKAVADAIARSEADLKASRDEINNLRKQLSDLKNQAKKDAKANDRWRDAEAKLIADIAAAKEQEKAAKEKADYFKKREEIIRGERLNAAVRNEYSKQRNRLLEADKKSTTTDDVAQVLAEVPEKSAETRKRIFLENWRTFKREWVNTKDELERFGALVGDEQITYAANNLGQASAAAQYSIGGSGQYDLNGKKIGDKNLTQVFAPAKKAGLIGDFYTYLLHEHNIDRMDIRNKAQKQLSEFRQKQNGSVNGFSELTDEDIIAAASNDSLINYPYTEEQQRAAKEFLQFRKWAENQFDKPVFGSSVTADDSRAAAAELLDAHPEFEKWAKDVYAYCDGLMEVRKQGGLVSEDMAQRMKELYPHYVPTYRDMPSTSGGYSNPNSVAVNSTIKSAKGGNQNIMPIMDSMARQTMQVFSAAKKNVLGNMLYNDAMDTTRDISEYIQSVTEEGDLVDLDADSAENLKNTLRIFVDGKPVTLHMSEAMADGFRPIEQSNSFGMKALRSINSTFKKLVTQWNPVFIVRNFVRDAQSALFFTHYSNATFVKNYGRAVKEITSNGKYWQLYQAMGGKGTTYYDPKTGLVDRKHFDNTALDKASEIKNKIVGILSAANESVEQFPRLAEFISTMEATGDVQKALYNAADITTNFGRGGFAARKLNATLVPFFNPGMQGLSKNIRNVIDRRGWKEIGQLISRLLINGVAPGIIMSLLYDGLKEDDDYKELSNYIKDSNILIKVGGDKFIKIPMGREPSVITAFTNRMWRWLKGEPASSAFAEYPSFAIEQLAPNNPLTNNIFSGITAMSTNKNWYGGDIVSSYMEEKPDYLQYDESTDAFSIWLGEITRHGKNGIEGLSPKKVNYLIDQYSGFIGDWVLPALSKKADVPAVVKVFVVDSVRQNRLGSDFYDALDEAKQVKDTELSTAADDATYSYLYKQSKAASEITKQLKEIYNSGEKTRKEKMSEARDLLELRNEIYRNALLTVGTYEETAKSIGSADSDVVKREANRKAFGAEYALKTYNKDVGEKAAEYVAQGVTYDQYYAAYFATRGITGEKDEDGKTITNSASRKKKEAIDKAVPNATTKQKHLLYEAIGVSKKVW